MTVWKVGDRDDAGAVGTLVATVVGLFAGLAAWAERRNPRAARSRPAQLAEAAEVLARLVRRQWQDEAALRQLYDPAPLSVLWTDSALPGVSDHRELIGIPITCRADSPEALATAFRGLNRRRLAVLGPAGSGKTTFVVLLTLALLHDRGEGDAEEPVPVLLSLASFDPARETLVEWLRHRIATDYPVLGDVGAYGPSVIDDLLSEQRLLPVLDGLDERPEEGRAAVLTALNETYDPYAPMVLTSRTADYTAAVAEAGVLSGAAVITPHPVRPDDALALLRLATPPGPRQQRWNALADHLSADPEAPAARVLASPLMVALARAVYVDAPGDPAELADTTRFTTPAAVEHHLLDALVPTLYGRARLRYRTGRRWDPERARRTLSHLAAGLHLRGTYDLSWWQLYRTVPVLTSKWVRAALWTAAAALLVCLAGAVARSRPWGYDPVEASGGTLNWIFLNVPTPAAVIVAGALFARARLPWIRVTRVPVTAVLAALCGAAVGVCVSVSFDLVTSYGEVGPLHQAQTALGRLGNNMVHFVLVLLVAGLPRPPDTPNRADFSLHRWRHRLPRALALVLTTALIGASIACASTLGLGDLKTSVNASVLGLACGAAVGSGLAVLRWVKGSSDRRDVLTPSHAIRADRSFAFLTCAVAVTMPVLVTELPPQFGNLVYFGGTDWVSITEWQLVAQCLNTWAFSLVVALNASAWTHYSAARLWLAARRRVPWRLQTFLRDAHRLGILRRVGPVYQFRHARLQHHLAVRQAASLPGPRRPDVSSGYPSRG
ncbi:NACHT domain-containing protein [Streptomyces sp. NPDC003077]|uniref:NACHT domain-containing protein n=1 Tax=Streptomyces sp. NPDC003077 TaxID=3154443 RepID=UPI0033AC60B9